MSARTLAPQWQPRGVRRESICRHCRRPVYAAPGDVLNGVAYWRHAGSHTAWCELDRSYGVFTQASPEMGMAYRWVVASGVAASVAASMIEAPAYGV